MPKILIDYIKKFIKSIIVSKDSLYIYVIKIKNIPIVQCFNISIYALEHWVIRLSHIL
jgi:hypothetical protein